jgi:hypothetical protein
MVWRANLWTDDTREVGRLFAGGRGFIPPTPALHVSWHRHSLLQPALGYCQVCNVGSFRAVLTSRQLFVITYSTKWRSQKNTTINVCGVAIFTVHTAAAYSKWWGDRWPGAEHRGAEQRVNYAIRSATPYRACPRHTGPVVRPWHHTILAATAPAETRAITQRTATESANHESGCNSAPTSPRSNTHATATVLPRYKYPSWPYDLSTQQTENRFYVNVR